MLGENVNSLLNYKITRNSDRNCGNLILGGVNDCDNNYYSTCLIFSSIIRDILSSISSDDDCYFLDKLNAFLNFCQSNPDFLKTSIFAQTLLENQITQKLLAILFFETCQKDFFLISISLIMKLNENNTIFLFFWNNKLFENLFIFVHNIIVEHRSNFDDVILSSLSLIIDLLINLKKNENVCPFHCCNMCLNNIFLELLNENNIKICRKYLAVLILVSDILEINSNTFYFFINVIHTCSNQLSNHLLLITILKNILINDLSCISSILDDENINSIIFNELQSTNHESVQNVLDFFIKCAKLNFFPKVELNEIVNFLNWNEKISSRSAYYIYLYLKNKRIDNEHCNNSKIISNPQEINYLKLLNALISAYSECCTPTKISIANSLCEILLLCKYDEPNLFENNFKIILNIIFESIELHSSEDFIINKIRTILYLGNSVLNNNTELSDFMRIMLYENDTFSNIMETTENEELKSIIRELFCIFNQDQNF